MPISLLRKTLRPLRKSLAPAAAGSPVSTMHGGRRWLLVFNCVNVGLANCIRLQAPEVDVEAIDFGRFKLGFDAWRQRLGDFELIITSPRFLQNDLVDFEQVARTRTAPIIHFDAYHPDLCYVTDGGKIAKGPMGDYHSQIVVAAHARRIPAHQVRALFSPERFASFGFFGRWDAARQQLLAGFRDAGMPVDAHYPGWGVHAPFMHSISHPAIRVLYDVATALLLAEGIEPFREGPIPHDNLLNGPVYPVYPEIAEALSVRGSYAFKLPAQYRCLDLDGFIAGSYAALDALGAGVEVHQAQRASYEKVLANL